MKETWEKFITTLNKYPWFTHIVITVWNAFIVSWATKISVPLTEFGIPIVINASAIVSWIQLHTHFPTWGVALMTATLNGFAYYINWKKTHTSTKETVNVIDTPTQIVTDKITETTKVQEK